MELFVHDPRYYTTVRNLDVIGQWKHQTCLYLSIKKNKPIDKVEKWLDWALENKHISYDDPILKIFRKDDKRDRYVDHIRLSSFLKEVNSRKLILAPTMTCYLPAKVMQSELSGFTEVEFYERKRIKKEGQRAKAFGDNTTAVNKNNQQNKKKEGINSISGLLTIETTPLANRSGHSTLTSTCRTATAFANANAERFFMGRRHFFDGPSVLESIIGILGYTDLDVIDNVMKKFNLHYVTPEELFKCLRYSYDSYFRSKKWDNIIWDFVKCLTPLQCSTYIYMGDMYHLRVFNETFMRDMFDGIMKFDTVEMMGMEETKEEMKNIDEFYQSFVSMMVSQFIGKKSIFEKEHEDKDYFGLIGARSKYVREYLSQYRELFHAFWRTGNLPSETAHNPAVHRRSVLGGDTDSNLFTCMQWVKWYNGTLEVNPTTKRTSMTVIYFLCMLVKHTLATVSGQMGIEEKYIHNLKMKNEFFFDVFVPSNRTKHYMAMSTMCEGQNTDPEIELKGVALKNSKAGKEINDDFHELCERLMTQVAAGEKIDIAEVIEHIAKLEANIFKSIMHGDSDYLASRTIKAKEAYNIPMSSDYANHELWNDVFADKYGHVGDPPYVGVRVAMDIKNATMLNIWLNGLADQEVATRFRQFMEKHNRKGIASILLPYDIVASTGIPEELKPIINARKIIFANVEPYYILLEMLSVYKLNQWFTKMCLDDRLDLLDNELRVHYEGLTKKAIDEAREEAAKYGSELESWENDDGIMNVDDDEDNDDE